MKTIASLLLAYLLTQASALASEKVFIFSLQCKEFSSSSNAFELRGIKEIHMPKIGQGKIQYQTKPTKNDPIPEEVEVKYRSFEALGKLRYTVDVIIRDEFGDILVRGGLRNERNKETNATLGGCYDKKIGYQVWITSGLE